MNRAIRAIASILLLLTAQVAFAQPGTTSAPDPATLRGDSVQTLKRLAEAEQKIMNGKATEAADELQRVLDEAGNDLITLDGRQYRPARWVAHGLLAKLPPDALKAYQDRIDQPARKFLDAAKRDRDPRPLWQLLDRYFVSRPADEALLLLGDFLFERGDFRAAEAAWRRLLPDAGGDVTYPGSKADAALVHARVVLAVIFQNGTERAKAEIDTFKAKHPNASGTLAGKTGPLAETLQAFHTNTPKLAPDATSGTAWPTYGGAPDRAGRINGGIPNAWPSRPWVASITDEFDAVGANFPPGRPPFGHPVIMNGEVFVSDGRRVFGFELQSGSKTRDYTPRIFKLPDGARFLPCISSLTAAGGFLYARIGPSTVRAPSAVGGKPGTETYLVCLEPRPGGKLVELWRIPPPEADKSPTAWEGAPVVSERRLWAVYAKFEGGRTIHVAVCYDPSDAGQAPERPTWTTELCDSPLPVANTERTRQELLTLAGRNVVFCSNNGAVVALDATTGRRAWGFRYPRSRKGANNVAGEPAPVVAFAGRVFLAPVDGEHVYALDADTGRELWESGPMDGARILGVSGTRLIVTVAGRVRGIRGLNLETGSLRDGGWAQHAGDGLLSYGQGLVTDDVIVWPSREGLYFLRPEDGRPKGDPLYSTTRDAYKGYFGHLAYADGVLVVVTSQTVRGYTAQSKKIEPRPDAPPRERFDFLIDRAEREVAAGNSTQAIATLAQIAKGDFPVPFRAWAAARMLQLTPRVSEPDRLPAVLRDALRPPLLGEWLLPPDGVPVTLETLLQNHLGAAKPRGSNPISPAVRPPGAPELGAESDIDRAFQLPHAVSPLAFIPGTTCPPKRFFAAGSRTLVAVPLDRGPHAEFAATDLFTHAAEVRNWFVVAGPTAVAVYGTVREPLWVFRVPNTDPLPNSAPVFRVNCDCDRPCHHLSSFVLTGSWLLARIGEHHLIALDLQARRVVWVLNTTGRASYEPAQFPTAVRFGPHIAVSGKFVVVQLSDGRRWFVAIDTGRPVAMPALGDQTARANWPHAPVVAENRVLISDGAGLLRLLQLGGRVKWAFEVEHDDGLTGEPISFHLWSDVLLVAVRRNHGVEIERVNLTDGKRVWSDSVFADAYRIDLCAADTDPDRAYVPVGNKLLATTLATGKSAWEADLPDTRGSKGWVVRAGKGCVIAYPAEAIPAELPGAVFDRLSQSFVREPFLWRLPGLAATLYDTWVARVVPVLVFDPETGKRLARIDIPARGPAVTAWFDADIAVVATGDRVVWIK